MSPVQSQSDVLLLRFAVAIALSGAIILAICIVSGQPCAFFQIVGAALYNFGVGFWVGRKR